MNDKDYVNDRPDDDQLAGAINRIEKEIYDSLTTELHDLRQRILNSDSRRVEQFREDYTWMEIDKFPGKVKDYLDFLLYIITPKETVVKLSHTPDAGDNVYVGYKYNTKTIEETGKVEDGDKI